MKECINKICRGCFLGLASAAALLAFFILLRALILTDLLPLQVIAAGLLVCLGLAVLRGLVLTVRGRHGEPRCGACEEGPDCPAYNTGVIYPCPHFRRKRNTKKQQLLGDQELPASENVLQDEADAGKAI